jgi:cell division protein ZapA
LEQPIKIKILDNEYLVRSEEDVELIHEIAEFVNTKFEEIKENASGLSESRTAILAAFHIASDYFQLLREQEKQSKDLKKRTQSLIYRVESVMG